VSEPHVRPPDAVSPTAWGHNLGEGEGDPVATHQGSGSYSLPLIRHWLYTVFRKLFRIVFGRTSSNFHELW